MQHDAPMPKESRVNTRIPPDIREQFDQALIEYVKERGEITLPLAIVPKSEVKGSGSAAAASRSATPQTETAAYSVNDPVSYRALRRKKPGK